MSNLTKHTEPSGNLQIVIPNIPADYMQGALQLDFVGYVGLPSDLSFFPVPFISNGLGLQL